MAKVLLLTNTLGASAEVLPALGLLQHQVKILPAEASVLVDAPEVDLLLIDARRDLPTVKSFAKLLDSTGVSCPIIAITTEGGLTALMLTGELMMSSWIPQALPKLMHVFASL
jgi:hypothetical protein